MNVSKERFQKLILMSLLIFLSTAFLVTAKTLANTIIITSYSSTVLPYFYFILAIAIFISTTISSKYLKESENKFAVAFKCVTLFSLLIFIIALQTQWLILPFCISVLLMAYSIIVSVIAWNYASDIFDIQEFKRFSKILQIASTIGAITAWGMVSILFSGQFAIAYLLIWMVVIELFSLALLIPIIRFSSAPVGVINKQLNLSSTIHRNSIFKYLAIITTTFVIMGTLIDYDLKLRLIADLEEDKLARFYSMIYVMSTIGIFIIQLFFIDYFFKVLGSKKIIAIYPIAILVATIITTGHYTLYTIAALFVINETFVHTTASLSRNLYLNILPRSVRLLGRMKLSGTIGPIAMICSSFVVLGITYTSHQTAFNLLTVICVCIFSIYLSIILIHKYRGQLTQSVYLRRFNKDLINMSQKDNTEIEDLLKQSLDYPAPEAKLFGLELLGNYPSLRLPDSIPDILSESNDSIVREVSRVLSIRRNQQQFNQAGKIALLKSKDEYTRWYLVLYLLDYDTENFLLDSSQLFKSQAASSLAILSLIYLKKGDLKQQIKAMKTLLNLFSSDDFEQNKWFLYVLNEINMVQKEKYLIQYINRGHPGLKKLAIRQIGDSPSATLLDCLVDNIGEPGISHVLNMSLTNIGDRVIDRVEMTFLKSNSYAIKFSCFKIISELRSSLSEQSLMRMMLSTQNVVMKTIMAKYVSYSGVKAKISQTLQEFLINKMKMEVELYFQLSAQLNIYKSSAIIEEINSRQQYIKKRVLYYTTAIVGSTDILNSIPLLSSHNLDVKEQSVVLELIDSTIENRKIASILMTLFIKKKKSHSNAKSLPVDDPWLRQYILDIESNNMDSIYMLTRLRKVDLFKNLLAETLQVLVDCCSKKDMANGEIICYEGDEGDGIYIVDSGEVRVTKNNIEIGRLSEGAYFGELALLADMPRFATVTALTDGVLFYINKQDFDKITDEIPEIMKSINKQVIEYLTKNVALLTKQSKG